MSKHRGMWLSATGLLVAFWLVIVLLPSLLTFAQETIGRESLWEPDDTAWTEFQECSDNLGCVRAVMEAAGASPQAIAFTGLLQGQGFMTSFMDLGTVDLAGVAYPGRANGNFQYILVNGSSGLVHVERLGDIDISQDPLFPLLVTRYPGLMIWSTDNRYETMEPRVPDGQRFIFNFDLVNGCHACEDAGYVRAAVDFDGAGKFLGVQVLSLVPAEGTLRLPEASGQVAFVSDRDGNSEIYLVNADGSGLTNLTYNLADDTEPAWSPDGTQIAFTSDRSGTKAIYIMNADGAGVRQLTNLNTGSYGPVWSPDGSRIAFASTYLTPVEGGQQYNLEIYWMNSDGSDLTKVYSQPGYGGRLSWFPDGQRLLFDNNSSGNFELFIVDLQGDVFQFIARSVEWDHGASPGGRWWDFLPAWSPDGQRIAFDSTRFYGQHKIYVANQDGSNVLNLSASASPGFGPVWSPDSRWVAFMSMGDGLHIAQADGNLLMKLADLSFIGVRAEWSWSPDSNYLAFAAPSADKKDIYVVGVDGTGLTNLTNHPAEDSDPVWRPPPAPTYMISGRITDVNSGEPIVGIKITDDAGHTVFTDDDGDYTLTGLISDTYTITPINFSHTFSPRFREVSIPPDAIDQDFVGCGDMDDDGLCDSWEIYGYDPDGDGPLFLDLPEMGADPNHKDIFVEIDYMEEVICTPTPLGDRCRVHSHRPNPDAVAIVVEAFKNAPVSNPDNVDGINLHVDFGPDTPMTPDENWGNHSRSTSLLHDDELNWTEFYELKSPNFDVTRNSIFHYAIFAHYYEDLYSGTLCSSGVSSPISDLDFIVSLGGWGWLDPLPGEPAPCTVPVRQNLTGTVWQQAGTFMHELGHNLGLKHGGGDDINGKPNYLSVMNYAFQTRGLIYQNNDGGTFDYSRSDKTPPLVETHLNETFGLNGGSSTASYGTKWRCPNGAIEKTLQANNPINWNCNRNDSETDIPANINDGWERNNPSPSNETLNSYFDWDNLIFLGGGPIFNAVGIETVVADSAMPVELTLEQDSLIPDPYKVGLFGSSGLIAPLGWSGNYTFTLANIGDNDDLYTLVASSSLGWIDLTSIPSVVSLASGETREIALGVTIPLTLTEGDVDVLKVTATSRGNSALWTSLYASTRVDSAVIVPVEGSEATALPDEEPEASDEITEMLTEGSEDPTAPAREPEAPEEANEPTAEPVERTQTTNWLPIAIGGLIGLFIITVGGMLWWRRRRASRQPSLNTDRFCIHCGAEYPPSGRFCIKCGRERV